MKTVKQLEINEITIPTRYISSLPFNELLKIKIIYKLPRRLSATPLQNLKGILSRSHDFGVGERFNHQIGFWVSFAQNRSFHKCSKI